jgi:O-acetyl-ADP-ribose deacetylase (regulator of RNase III)
MNIVLVAVDDPLAEAWQQNCGNLDNVTVQRGSILDVHCDAVVSPANSFGFMDGGIDMLYSRYFGWQVQDRLQHAIRTRFHGELLVGQSEIVWTNDARIPYLIAAPTMRVPMILTHSVNPYLAARAVLLLLRNGTFADGPHAGEPIASVVQTVAFPGLGTGVGQVPPEVCARQVRAAILNVLHGAEPFPESWFDAAARHQALYSERIRDLQRPE